MDSWSSPDIAPQCFCSLDFLFRLPLVSVSCCVPFSMSSFTVAYSILRVEVLKVFRSMDLGLMDYFRVIR